MVGGLDRSLTAYATARVEATPSGRQRQAAAAPAGTQRRRERKRGDVCRRGAGDDDACACARRRAVSDDAEGVSRDAAEVSPWGRVNREKQRDCGPFSSDDQLLDLVLDAVDLGLQIGAIADSDTDGNDGPRDAARTPQRLFRVNEHVGNVLVLAQQWQVPARGASVSRVRGAAVRHSQ